ncbi:unnamed protein product [Mytilus edulis]|uniref:Uncharacterized protein n=1 Tax=Mytilus edulis TaxID=6550 RepID=A0A8S3UQ96_MYTED|nr:unnamed protein product [Mytilus edulis]
MNTEELIVNYHSISTVFDVTTQSGITKSLKSATRWLQARSDLDKRYYDAYLKQYPLEHKDPQGEVSKMEVCMRDCYNIVYLDNLVRWSIHADPDPGKNRTSQICTLPITIKGLPKQSYIIKSWHQQDCDLLVNCNCMQQIKLGKDQCKLLLEYEDKEKEALQILDDIEDENILDISKELGNLDISMESTWLADIDTSMRSMKLDDYVDEDEPDDQNGINLDNLDEIDEFLDDIIEEEDFLKILLHVHYTSGVFHTNMKQCLFTTPHKNSNVNFALDAQREMDHLDAVKGFRPRSTIDAVIPRMSIVDHFTDVQQFRQELNKSDVNETVLSQQNKTDDGENQFTTYHQI